jgi:hypothetical protein
MPASYVPAPADMANAFLIAGLPAGFYAEPGVPLYVDQGLDGDYDQSMAFAPDVEGEPFEPYTRPILYAIDYEGMLVVKKFPGSDHGFLGRMVKSVSPLGYWRVVYEDGDREDMDEWMVLKNLVDHTFPHVVNQAWMSGHKQQRTRKNPR